MFIRIQLFFWCQLNKWYLATALFILWSPKILIPWQGSKRIGIGSCFNTIRYYQFVQKIARLVLAMSLASTSLVALAQSSSVRFSIGPDVGVYFPTDSKIKSVFGSSIFGFGLHFGGADLAQKSGFGGDIGLVSAQKNGSDFYAFQLMGKYEKYFGHPHTKGFVPYAEVSAGLAYADYKINYGGGHFAAKVILPTAKFEAGFLYHRDFKFSIEYDLFGPTNGFRFDGLTLKATYIVYRF